MEVGDKHIAVFVDVSANNARGAVSRQSKLAYYRGRGVNDEDAVSISDKQGAVRKKTKAFGSGQTFFYKDALIYAVAVKRVYAFCGAVRDVDAAITRRNARWGNEAGEKRVVRAKR
ncbi:MAG: hypothetical protein LBS86_06255 [Treponema sp.]|nr:hypothetical protein [Treponema sp.]